MYGHDTKSEVFEAAAAETRGFHTFEQGFLGWKLADAFHEVLITVAVFGDNFPHFGDEAVGIEVVDPAEHRFGDLGEFEAVESPAGFEDAQGFG